MAVREGNSRQMVTLRGDLLAKVRDVSRETGLSVSKVISASTASLVDPGGSSRENDNARLVAGVVGDGSRWDAGDWGDGG